jgi:hypothetical protein
MGEVDRLLFRVTGSPDRCRNLYSPQTLSDVKVRVGTSRPIDGSAMTIKHGPWAKDFASGSKKLVNTRIPPRVLREAMFCAWSSPFRLWVA